MHLPRQVTVQRMHHVAFAHGPGEAVHERLTALLGLPVTHCEAGEGFVERMLAVGDHSWVQTLEATGPGVVQRFIGRRGPALHHIAFEVADLDATLAALRADDVPLVDAEPRPGGMGTRIAFLHPSACGGLLVELVAT